MIKDWSDKANEKNKNESSDSKFVWRVRGCRKNWLQLKRFLKPTQATDSNQVMVKKVFKQLKDNQEAGYTE